jgi:ribosomal protein S18 acetylase RimI-like enzyme
MGVLKEYRQLGIGKILAEQTIKKAKQQNMLRIELEVLASNLPAIGLYEKLGFQVEGIKKNARIIDGVSDDLIQMVLFIN